MKEPFWMKQMRMKMEKKLCLSKWCLLCSRREKERIKCKENRGHFSDRKESSDRDVLERALPPIREASHRRCASPSNSRTFFSHM